MEKTKEEFNREICGGKKIWYYQGYYTTLLGERKNIKVKNLPQKMKQLKKNLNFYKK